LHLSCFPVTIDGDHTAGIHALPGVDLMSSGQLDQLRAGYAGINTIDPSQPSYGRLTALLDASGPQRLQQLADAKIKFVSNLARNRLPRK